MYRTTLFPEQNNYSQSHIFLNLILPLVEKYEEVLWFADEKVAITQEKSTQQQLPGWTNDLASIGKIKGDSLKGKYIELERMLSSIVFLHLFYDGSKSAYEKFISIQLENIALTWTSFQAIHQLAKNVIKNKDDFALVEAMLIYSDLGKTSKAREKAKKLSINHADHDDWIEAVLSQENPADISKIIPSFFRLSIENKKFLQKIALAMKIHLGHVVHLEGGKKMFDKLHTSVSKGMVDQTIMQFAFLIQLCDVAASAAHENNQGSSALVEGWYQAYMLVKAACEVIAHGGTSEEALSLYVKQRGKQYNLNAEDPNERILIRLSCMLRFYNQDNSELLKEISKQLSAASWQVLQAQFDLFTGINIWKRNPTYLPAVLLNLAQLNSHQETMRDKLIRAVNGFVCLAQLLKQYGQDEANKNNDTPLCFNALAKFALEKPAYFLIENFDPMAFQINDSNNYIFNEAPQATLKNINQ